MLVMHQLPPRNYQKPHNNSIFQDCLVQSGSITNRRVQGRVVFSTMWGIRLMTLHNSFKKIIYNKICGMVARVILIIPLSNNIK